MLNKLLKGKTQSTKQFIESLDCCLYSDGHLMFINGKERIYICLPKDMDERHKEVTIGLQKSEYGDGDDYRDVAEVKIPMYQEY
jgi:hypothetical protein